MKYFTVYRWEGENLVPISDVQGACARDALQTYYEVTSPRLRKQHGCVVVLPAVSHRFDQVFDHEQ